MMLHATTPGGVMKAFPRHKMTPFAEASNRAVDEMQEARRLQTANALDQ